MQLGETTIVDDLRSLPLRPLEPGAAAIYDRRVELCPLFEDPVSGEEHDVIRYPAGTRGRAHRHSAAHTLVGLEGRLDANGREIGPTANALFPGGQTMRHQASAALRAPDAEARELAYAGLVDDLRRATSGLAAARR